MRPHLPAFRAVADDLLLRIKTGEFPIASNLPREVDLAGQYGVSRSTVREALRIVSAYGVIITRRGTAGGSVIVANVAEAPASTVATAALAGKHVDSAEIVATRALFDVPTARAAARRCTPKELAELRTTVESPGTGLTRADAFDANWRFHAVLYRVSGGPLVSAVAYPLARFAHENHFTSFSSESAPNSMRDHLLIVDAIEAGDAFAAGARMVEHLQRLALVHA